MHSTKYTLSILLGLLLFLSSCSLLEKKSAPDTLHQQEDTQTENQDNTPPADTEKWEPELPLDPLNPLEPLDALLSTLSEEQQEALRTAIIEQNEAMTLVSLERFLATLEAAIEKETDAEKKSILENNLSDMQSIGEKRAYINSLQKKLQNIGTEMQQLLSPSEDAENVEENTQKANELSMSFMETQTEYEEKMGELEAIFQNLQPDHVQLLETYFLQDLIAGVTKAQPDIDPKLIEDILREILRYETQAPNIQNVPTEENAPQIDTPPKEE